MTYETWIVVTLHVLIEALLIVRVLLRPHRQPASRLAWLVIRVVLPVGGIKEKLLAARRAGIRRVVLPEPNEKDVAEIPAELLKGLELEYVGSIDEALQHTLAAPV